jgi:hypothetical protein
MVLGFKVLSVGAMSTNLIPTLGQIIETFRWDSCSNWALIMMYIIGFQEMGLEFEQIPILF